jgi:hypothetical protein
VAQSQTSRNDHRDTRGNTRSEKEIYPSSFGKVKKSNEPGSPTILSIFAHGLSATPGIALYAGKTAPPGTDAAPKIPGGNASDTGSQNKN